MQFQVPQFIDVEDKIIGPLTLKQFLYMGAAGLGGFLTFFVFNFTFWIIIMVIFGGLAITLAFVKYNGRSMVIMLGAIFKYMWKPKMYIWRRSINEKTMFADVKINSLPSQSKPKSTKNPLKNLFLRLNTSREAVAGREKVSPATTKNAVKNQMKRKVGSVNPKNAF